MTSILVFLALYILHAESFISYVSSSLRKRRVTLGMGYYNKNEASRRSLKDSRGSASIGKYIRGGRDNSIRQSRIARAIKIELADIIADVDIKATTYPDEDLMRGTSVVDVDISPDLSYAKVFVTILGNAVERRQVYVWLCNNAGQVRYSLARRLRHMKRVPDLYFKLADAQAAADLVNLIDELSEEREARGAEGGDLTDFDFEEEEDEDEAGSNGMDEWAEYDE